MSATIIPTAISVGLRVTDGREVGVVSRYDERTDTASVQWAPRSCHYSVYDASACLVTAPAFRMWRDAQTHGWTSEEVGQALGREVGQGSREHQTMLAAMVPSLRVALLLELRELEDMTQGAALTGDELPLRDRLRRNTLRQAFDLPTTPHPDERSVHQLLQEARHAA